MPSLSTSGDEAPRMYPRRRLLVGLGALPVAALVGCRGDDKEPQKTKSPAATQPPATPSPTAARSTSQASPSPTSSAARYFPPTSGEWEKADLAKTGWSPAGVEKLVTTVGASRSATFMVLSGGRIVTENYFGSTTASTVLDVASVQKSVASTLLGIAREKGLLSLEDPVSKYLPQGWSRASAADEAKITILHLMTHSSGLDPRTLRKVAEPGTTFDYNTDAYQKTRLVLEKAANTDINTLSRQWIFDAIGISKDAHWAPRPSGDQDATGAPQWGLLLSARDMARFGLLSLRRGNWVDRQLIKGAWYDEAWSSSKVARDYGLLWWLMGKKPKFAKAPNDWVAALGAQDQKIYVIPSFDVVVTRQGLAAAEASETESDFDRVLIEALAAARA